MVADFSALDAELDALGAGPAVDAAALASSYVGELGRLPEIDAALSALAVDESDLPAAAAPTFALDLPSRAAAPHSVPPPPSAPSAHLDSDEIALPNAMRAPTHDESGELPLEGAAPQSGSFALPYEDALPSAEVAFADDLTFDADVEDLVEITPEPARPNGNGLFELRDRDETDHAAEADFAALFPDPPAALSEVNYDDTEVFDSSALDFEGEKPKLEPIENAFTAEELDSAEFEIVMESTESGTQATPSSSIPPRPSSSAPEKRPSFLGRLFGRKEE